MNSAVDFISWLVGYCVDLLLAALRFSSALGSLIILSALAGIALLYLYGKVSKQSSIAAVKKKIGGALLESLLFRHDASLALKAQFQLFLLAFRYLALAIPPLLILAIPCILLMAQLNLHFGSRPLKSGEGVLIKASLDDSVNLQELKLETSPALIQSPAVRDLQNKEVWWKVQALQPGVQNLALKDRSQKNIVETKLVVEGAQTKIFSRYGKGFWDKLLYPSASLLPTHSSALKAFQISYPAASFSLLGFNLSWIVVFLIVSLLAGLLASKFLGVEI